MQLSDVYMLLYFVPLHIFLPYSKKQTFCDSFYKLKLVYGHVDLNIFSFFKKESKFIVRRLKGFENKGMTNLPFSFHLLSSAVLFFTSKTTSQKNLILLVTQNKKRAVRFYQLKIPREIKRLDYNCLLQIGNYLVYKYLSFVVNKTTCFHNIL